MFSIPRSARDGILHDERSGLSGGVRVIGDNIPVA
jgi:hypothetical protein